MSSPRVRELSALVSGVLFGIGLVVSGMTEPSKVLGFLDVLGDWDPSLAFVMLGAIGVHAIGLRCAARLRKPLASPAFSVAPAPSIDARLVVGATTFGVGWGLSGYCPGPAIVALPAVGASGLVFVGSLALGSALGGLVQRPLQLEPPRLRFAELTEEPPA